MPARSRTGISFAQCARAAAQNRTKRLPGYKNVGASRLAELKAEAGAEFGAPIKPINNREAASGSETPPTKRVL